MENEEAGGYYAGGTNKKNSGNRTQESGYGFDLFCYLLCKAEE